MKTEKRKPRRLAGTDAAFMDNDSRRDDKAFIRFIKPSRRDRRQKNSWKRWQI